MPRLDDGFPTTISFADNPTVLFYEKSVTPPSMEGGGANDTTTMRNIAYRTRSPKKLKNLGEMSFNASYDPDVFGVAEVFGMINNNQLITITFPAGETLAFYGWVDRFQPGEIQEGQQPTATVTIICSNQNDAGTEVAPAYVG